MKILIVALLFMNTAVGIFIAIDLNRIVDALPLLDNGELRDIDHELLCVNARLEKFSFDEKLKMPDAFSHGIPVHPPWPTSCN